MNIAVLSGTLSSDPRIRDLSSGSVVVNYELTTRTDEGPARTVPVAWFDPPESARDLEAGAEVVVVGEIVRRFWRPPSGGTASTTEVVARRVIPARQRRRVGQALAHVLDEISLEAAD